MRRKSLIYAVTLLAFTLLATALLAGGCGSSTDKTQQSYSEGYDAGVKAEQAKWSAEKLKLAQTYIKEQEDSQETIQRLLRGEMLGITIDAINVDDSAGKGTVEITANMRDGSKIKGVIDVVKIDSLWYLEKITQTPS
jgi:hypothetical protein